MAKGSMDVQDLLDLQEWFQKHPLYNDVHRAIREELDEAERKGKPIEPFTAQYQDKKRG